MAAATAPAAPRRARRPARARRPRPGPRRRPRPRAVSRVDRECDVAGHTDSSTVEARAGASRRTPAMPSRKSSLRDDSSSANASFCELALERARLPGVQQPLREPERDGRARRRAAATSSSTASSSVGRPATARWITPHSAASVAVELAAEQQQLPGPDHADQAGQQPGGAAVGGEAPLGERLPEAWRRRPRRVKSAASASWKPMPGRPAPHRAHDRHLDVAAAAGSAGAPARAAGAGCCRRAAARRRSALRATMSAPPQKWSPAPASTMTRTASSRPARVDGVDERRPSSRRRSRCASRAGRASSRSTPSSSSTARPSTDA